MYNKIHYFSTVVSDVDVAGRWTYINDATNGFKMTIDVAGWYAFSLTFNFNTSGHAGFSLNSSELTTSIVSLTSPADAIAIQGTSGSGVQGNCAIVRHFAVNDIIRVHGDGASHSNDAFWNLTVKALL